MIITITAIFAIDFSLILYKMFFYKEKEVNPVIWKTEGFLKK